MEIKDIEVLKFSLVMSLVLIIISNIVLPFFYGMEFTLVTFYFSFSFIFISFVAPKFVRPVMNAWLKLSHILGWINTFFILSLVFFAIFTPIGLLAKIWGYDPMLSRSAIKDKSYFRTPKSENINMENPF